MECAACWCVDYFWNKYKQNIDPINQYDILFCRINFQCRKNTRTAHSSNNFRQLIKFSRKRHSEGEIQWFIGNYIKPKVKTNLIIFCQPFFSRFVILQRFLLSLNSSKLRQRRSISQKPNKKYFFNNNIAISLCRFFFYKN